MDSQNNKAGKCLEFVERYENQLCPIIHFICKLLHIEENIKHKLVKLSLISLFEIPVYFFISIIQMKISSYFDIMFIYN